MIRVTHQGTALGMKLLSTIALLFSGSYKKTTPGVVVQGLPEFTETVCVCECVFRFIRICIAVSGKQGLLLDWPLKL